MSADYNAAREQLRAAEVDLMVQREAVAAMWRSHLSWWLNGVIGALAAAALWVWQFTEIVL